MGQMGSYRAQPYDGRRRSPRAVVLDAFVLIALLAFLPLAYASHSGHEDLDVQRYQPPGPGHAIPGVPFRVYVDQSKESSHGHGFDETHRRATLETVVEAFGLLVQQRADYPRFDEALKKGTVQHVIIEPTVINRDGKAFPFLVARTKDPGRVNLLISASFLEEKGYLSHPDKLAPVLAREFQWVVSKADTAPKPKLMAAERDLAHAPVRMDKEILEMSGGERAQLLQQLF